MSMNSDRPKFVMAAASQRQIGFLFKFGGTLARYIGRALALGKPRDGRGSVMGGEAKKLPPCYGTSVAPAARLTDPGLTRADTGAGRVCNSTTRRPSSRRGRARDHSGRCSVAAIMHECGTGDWVAGGRWEGLHHAGSLGGCILYANLYRVFYLLQL